MCFTYIKFSLINVLAHNVNCYVTRRQTAAYEKYIMAYKFKPTQSSGKLLPRLYIYPSEEEEKKSVVFAKEEEQRECLFSPPSVPASGKKKICVCKLSAYVN